MACVRTSWGERSGSDSGGGGGAGGSGTSKTAKIVGGSLAFFLFTLLLIYHPH